ncbi:hypothetical protein GWK53_03390 [Burkholderia cepacia]|uniref:hypothetical protein n=1 Tax=Burkholderia cepacia TaxID=292 RepID=UPI0013F3EB6E|nr:hypothetical protein [Burkholderia cepacia]NHB05548.1 hypothetical protein [Burkholderia cepacia]
MRNRIQASVEPDAPLFSFSARDAATPVGKGGSAIAARFSTGLCTEIVDKSAAGA